MGDRFYWRGNTAYGDTGGFVDGITNAANFLWNKAGNWMKFVDGTSGGSTQDFYIEHTLDIPGGGDNAVFQRFRKGQYGLTGSQGYDIPVAPLLWGGYWNEDTDDRIGWHGAGTTSGKCNIYIHPDYGYNPVYQSAETGNTGNPNASRIGLFSWGNEAQLIYEYEAGRGSTYPGGVTMGHGATAPVGVRVNSTSIIHKAAEHLHFDLVNSAADNISLFPYGYTRCHFEGGTFIQVFIDAPSYDNKSISFEDWTLPFAGVTTAVGTSDITDYLNISTVNGWESFISVKSNTTIPTVTIDTPHRCQTIRINANITTLNSYPEERRVINARPDYYRAVVFSGGLTGARTIGTANLYRSTSHVPDGSRTVFDEGEGVDDNTNPSGLRGANNLIGLDKTQTFTIDNAIVLGGRLVVGNWNLSAQGDVTDHVHGRRAYMPDTSNVLIKDGQIGKEGVVDTRNPSDNTWKGYKVGAGTAHPTTNEGLEILNSKAELIVSPNMHVVVDYVLGQSGATFSNDLTDGGGSSPSFGGS